MTARRTLALALISSVALAGLVTAGATGASGAAPAAKVQPRTSVTNTSAYAIIKTVSINNANGVAVNDADDTVYVTSSDGINNAGSLIAFDGREWDDSTVVSTNTGAWAVAVDQSDDTVYVTNNNGLCAFRGVDLFRNGSACTSGRGPMYAVAVDQGDDTVYGVATGSSLNNIYTFKGSSNPGSFTPIVTAYGGGALGAAVDNIDDTLYAPNPNGLLLRRFFGPSTSEVIPGLTIATPSLLGIALDQNDDTIYVNSTFDALTAVNGKSWTVDDSVRLSTCNSFGASQGGVAVDQRDDTVYVACTNNLRLFALDPANLDDTSVSIITGGTDSVAVDNDDTNLGIVYATSQAPAGGTLKVVAPGVDPDVPPTTGPAGTAVTITLNIPNLASSFPLDSGTITGVKFGSASGTSLQQVGGPTARTWSVAAPSGTAGTTVDVVVTFNGNQTALAGTFTYTGSPTPTPVYPPDAPTDVKATAGSGEATITWTAPTYVGSFPISDYQVASSSGSHTCLSKTTSCTVTGLTGGTTYTFTVRALNGAGWGAYSSPSNAVTPIAKSSLIIGSRDASDDRYVKVEGTTTDLAGKQVVPWVRFPGQTDYAAGTGVRTVSADGTFTWQRKTGKKTYVYFEHLAVRSNTVIIPAR